MLRFRSPKPPIERKTERWSHRPADGTLIPTLKGYNASCRKPLGELATTPAGWRMSDEMSWLGEDGNKHINTDNNLDKTYFVTSGPGASTGSFQPKQVARESEMEMRAYLARLLLKSKARGGLEKSVEAHRYLCHQIPTLQAKLWISASRQQGMASKEHIAMAHHIRQLVQDLESGYILVLRNRYEAGLPICDHPYCLRVHSRLNIVPEPLCIMLEPLIDWETLCPVRDKLFADGDLLVFRRSPFTTIPGFDLRTLIPANRLRFCIHCLEDLWYRQHTVYHGSDSSSESTEQPATPNSPVPTYNGVELVSKLPLRPKPKNENCYERPVQVTYSRGHPNNHSSASSFGSDDTAILQNSENRVIDLDGAYDHSTLHDVIEIPDSQDEAVDEELCDNNGNNVEMSQTASNCAPKKPRLFGNETSAGIEQLATFPELNEAVTTPQVYLGSKYQGRTWTAMNKPNYADLSEVTGQHSQPNTVLGNTLDCASSYPQYGNKASLPGGLRYHEISERAHYAGVMVSDAQREFLENYQINTPRHRRNSVKQFNSQRAESADPTSSAVGSTSRMSRHSSRIGSRISTTPSKPRNYPNIKFVIEDKKSAMICKSIDKRIRREKQTRLIEQYLKEETRKEEQQARKLEKDLRNAERNKDKGEDWITQVMDKYGKTHPKSCAYDPDVVPQSVEPSMPISNHSLRTITLRLANHSLPALVWCYCRRPDDGKMMIMCSGSNCFARWFHNDCLGQYEKTVASRLDRRWQCQSCKLKESLPEGSQLHFQIPVSRDEMLHALAMPGHVASEVDNGACESFWSQMGGQATVMEESISEEVSISQVEDEGSTEDAKGCQDAYLENDGYQSLESVVEWLDQSGMPAYGGLSGYINLGSGL